MLHDVIIFVPFFNLFQFVFIRITKNLKYKVFSIFPQKGTLTFTLEMGVGGDHLGPPKFKKITKTSPKILKSLKKTLKKYVCSIFFPLGGNFDIDAGDGGESNPNNPKKIQKKRRIIENIYYNFQNISLIYSYIFI